MVEPPHREPRTPKVDLTSAALWRAPGASLAPLFESDARAARLTATDSAMLFRHDDVTTALTDARLGAMGVRALELMGWSGGPFLEWMRRNIVAVDPPAHTRLRGLVNRAFTPRRVEALADVAREIAEGLADEVAEAREVDFYASFAQRLPLAIICRMLGIPKVDHEEMAAWTGAINAATGIPRAEARQAADDAVAAMISYADALISERRRRPTDDLMSALIDAEEAGERLGSDELPVMILQLLVAGHETTRNLIGNGLHCLLRHPDQLAVLRADASLMRNAVEEMIRFEPSLIWVARVARRDLEVGGGAPGAPVIAEPGGGGPDAIAVGRDKLILLNLAAANRDPAHHPDPNTFDVRRREIRVLSFGFGAHFCIGANLARLEGRVAFETLLGRFEKLEFVGDPPQFAPYTALRTLESFRLRATPV